MILRSLLLRLADSAWAERVIRRNAMSAGLVRRFVAGDDMQSTVEPVRALNAQGVTVSLDCLGENVTVQADADRFALYYHDLLAFIARNDLHAGISLKLTQLGLDIDPALAQRHLDSIVEAAASVKRFVRIDMEASGYVDRTLSAFYAALAEHPNVGIVVQACLHRTHADVERLVQAGAQVRLVKGAYRELPTVAVQTTRDIRAGFSGMARRLLAGGAYTAIATHDDTLVASALTAASELGLARDRYEFQVLYGMRRDLQESLVARGNRMRVYMPFGTHWYGYLTRRLAERPANLWFFLRNAARR